MPSPLFVIIPILGVLGVATILYSMKVIQDQHSSNGNYWNSKPDPKEDEPEKQSRRHKKRGGRSNRRKRKESDSDSDSDDDDGYVEMSFHSNDSDDFTSRRNKKSYSSSPRSRQSSLDNVKDTIIPRSFSPSVVPPPINTFNVSQETPNPPQFYNPVTQPTTYQRANQYFQPEDHKISGTNNTNPPYPNSDSPIPYPGNRQYPIGEGHRNQSHPSNSYPQSAPPAYDYDPRFPPMYSYPYPPHFQYYPCPHNHYPPCPPPWYYNGRFISNQCNCNSRECNHTSSGTDSSYESMLTLRMGVVNESTNGSSASASTTGTSALSGQCINTDGSHVSTFRHSMGLVNDSSSIESTTSSPVSSQSDATSWTTACSNPSDQSGSDGAPGCKTSSRRYCHNSSADIDNNGNSSNPTSSCRRRRHRQGSQASTKDKECFICCVQAPVVPMVILKPCGHSGICKYCIEVLLNDHSVKCPVCRIPIKSYKRNV